MRNIVKVIVTMVLLVLGFSQAAEARVIDEDLLKICETNPADPNCPCTITLQKPVGCDQNPRCHRGTTTSEAFITPMAEGLCIYQYQPSDPREEWRIPQVYDGGNLITIMVNGIPTSAVPPAEADYNPFSGVREHVQAREYFFYADRANEGYWYTAVAAVGSNQHPWSPVPGVTQYRGYFDKIGECRHQPLQTIGNMNNEITFGSGSCGL